MKYLSKKYWDKFTKTSNDKIIRDGIAFEKLVAQLLLLEYGVSWKHTKKSHDQNRDFYLYLKDERLWAECKNYQSKISMDILAPTLVMAQIYDVDTIIIFSYSPLNKYAREKIYAFGSSTGKKVLIYDDEVLEELIIKHRQKLPIKYRPFIVDIKSREKYFIPSLYFLQNPILGIDNSEDSFQNIDTVTKIYYNKVFGIAVDLQNPYIEKDILVEIYFENGNQDLFRYRFWGKGKIPTQSEPFNILISAASGIRQLFYFSPHIFQKKIFFPQVHIKYWSDKNKSKLLEEWLDSPRQVECHWHGYIALIGTQYHKILEDFSRYLIDNQSLSVLTISGGSGTGKTRILTELVNLLLQSGYRILSLISIQDFSSSYLLREIIYFLYEIPRVDILKVLETEDVFSIQPQSSIEYAFHIIQQLKRELEEPQLKELVQKYFAVIYEKMGNSKLAILIDNIQYSGEAFQFFVREYYAYARNQGRTNYSILVTATNTDYITENTSKTLSFLNNRDYEYTLSFF